MMDKDLGASAGLALAVERGSTGRLTSLSSD